MADLYRVLFLCTGNICRSAYADVVARDAGITGVEFGSAGTHAVVGAGISAEMADQVRGRGRPERHVARQVTRELALGADLIVAMAEEHRRFVLGEWPEAIRRTFVIGHVARELTPPIVSPLAGWHPFSGGTAAWIRTMAWPTPTDADGTPPRKPRGRSTTVSSRC